MHYPTDRLAHIMAFVNTSCGALDGTRNTSMDRTLRIDPMTYHTMSGSSTTDLHLAPADILVSEIILIDGQ